MNLDHRKYLKVKDKINDFIGKPIKGYGIIGRIEKSSDIGADSDDLVIWFKPESDNFGPKKIDFEQIKGDPVGDPVFKAISMIRNAIRVNYATESKDQKQLKEGFLDQLKRFKTELETQIGRIIWDKTYTIKGSKTGVHVVVGKSKTKNRTPRQTENDFEYPYFVSIFDPGDPDDLNHIRQAVPGYFYNQVELDSAIKRAYQKAKEYVREIDSKPKVSHPKASFNNLPESKQTQMKTQAKKLTVEHLKRIIKEEVDAFVKEKCDKPKMESDNPFSREHDKQESEKQTTPSTAKKQPERSKEERRIDRALGLKEESETSVVAEDSNIIAQDDEGVLAFESVAETRARKAKSLKEAKQAKLAKLRKMIREMIQREKAQKSKTVVATSKKK